MNSWIYKNWEIVTEIPIGWKLEKIGSPLFGHRFIIDKSPLLGGKRKLYKIPKEEIDQKREEMMFKSSGESIIPDKKKVVVEFPKQEINTLARLRAKERILQDISADLMICEIEGWSKKQYLLELIEIFDGFKKKLEKRKENKKSYIAKTLFNN